MTEAEIREQVPKQCPKCSKFVEVVVIHTDEKTPGVYCNGCEWKDKLPGTLDPIRDHNRVIGPSLITMLAHAPQNPSFRKLVQTTVSKPIPKTCTTFADIVFWLSRVPIKKPIASPLPKEDCVIRIQYSYTSKVTQVVKEYHSGPYALSIRPEEMITKLEASTEDTPSWRDLVIRMRAFMTGCVQQIRPQVGLADRETIEELERTDRDRVASVAESELSLVLSNWINSAAPHIMERIRR